MPLCLIENGAKTLLKSSACQFWRISAADTGCTRNLSAQVSLAMPSSVTVVLYLYPGIFACSSHSEVDVMDEVPYDCSDTSTHIH